MSLCNRKAFGIPQTWKGEWKGNIPSMGTDTPLGKAQHRLTAHFLIGHSPVHSGWVSRHPWCAPSPKTAEQTNPISFGAPAHIQRQGHLPSALVRAGLRTECSRSEAGQHPDLSPMKSFSFTVPHIKKLKLSSWKGHTEENQAPRQTANTNYQTGDGGQLGSFRPSHAPRRA